MGILMSSFSKLDNIINPETHDEILPVTSESIAENTPSTEAVHVPIEPKNNTPTKPVLEPELTPSIETSSNTSVSLEVKEEDTSNLGKKVEVMPVNISDTADVIKKSTRKRKKHHMG